MCAPSVYIPHVSHCLCLVLSLVDVLLSLFKSVSLFSLGFEFFDLPFVLYRIYLGILSLFYHYILTCCHHFWMATSNSRTFSPCVFPKTVFVSRCASGIKLCIKFPVSSSFFFFFFFLASSPRVIWWQWYRVKVTEELIFIALKSHPQPVAQTGVSVPKIQWLRQTVFFPSIPFPHRPSKKEISVTRVFPSRTVCVRAHTCLPYNFKKALLIRFQHITFKPSELDVALALSWSSELTAHFLLTVSWDSLGALNCPISFALMYKIHEDQPDDLILPKWDDSLLHLFVHKLRLLCSAHIFILNKLLNLYGMTACAFGHKITEKCHQCRIQRLFFPCFGPAWVPLLVFKEGNSDQFPTL